MDSIEQNIDQNIQQPVKNQQHYSQNMEEETDVQTFKSIEENQHYIENSFQENNYQTQSLSEEQFQKQDISTLTNGNNKQFSKVDSPQVDFADTQLNNLDLEDKLSSVYSQNNNNNESSQQQQNLLGVKRKNNIFSLMQKTSSEPVNLDGLYQNNNNNNNTFNNNNSNYNYINQNQIQPELQQHQVLHRTTIQYESNSFFQQMQNKQKTYVSQDIQQLQNTNQQQNKIENINYNVNQNQIQDQQQILQQQQNLSNEINQDQQYLDDYQQFNRQQRNQQRKMSIIHQQTDLFCVLLVKKNNDILENDIEEEDDQDDETNQNENYEQEEEQNQQQNQQQNTGKTNDCFNNLDNQQYLENMISDFLESRQKRKGSLAISHKSSSYSDINSINNDDFTSEEENEPQILKKVKGKKKCKISEISSKYLGLGQKEKKIDFRIQLQDNIAVQLQNQHFTHYFKDDYGINSFFLNFFNYEDYQQKLEQSYFQNDKFKNNYLVLGIKKQKLQDQFIAGQGRDSNVKVLRCLKIKDNQIVAIKRILLEKKPDVKNMFKEKIFQQIKCMQKFNHPNIVQYRNFWLEESQKPQENQSNNSNESQILTKYYLNIEMEYLSYESTCNSLLDYLDQYLFNPNISQQEQQVSNKQIIKNIFKQICTGLQYLHNLGYFHCDLKPENILITQDLDGNIIAKLTDFDDTFKFSQDNTLKNPVGTIGYVQKSIGNVYEFRDDLYSLGHILLDLVKFDDKKRLSLHQNLQRGQFPQDFEQNYPEEFLLIQILVIKKNIKSIDTLINKSSLYKRWLNQENNNN